MALPNMAMIPSGYKPTKLYSVLPTETTTGVNKITNGDFATDTKWSKGTGWSISGGSANCDGSQGGTTELKQQGGVLGVTLNFVVGKIYKVNYDIVVTSGAITYIEVASGTDQTDIDTSGNRTTYITAASTNNRFTIAANSTFIGSIDNVSVQEVLVGNADFDVTRATPATRVNQQGLIETPEFILSGDLVTNGDFSNGSTDWSLGSGWTIGSKKVDAVDSVFGSSFTQNMTIVSGKQYKVSFDVSNYIKGNVRMSVGNALHTPVESNGSFTFFLTAANTNTLKAETRAGGSGTTLSVSNISVIQVERNNIPRLDYTDGTCPVLLTEPQSTNLVPTSESFSSYTIGTATVTPNSTTAPDGTNSGVLATIGSSTLLIRVSNIIDFSKTYTFTGYFKSSGSATSVALDITDVNQTTFDLTDEWQRFSVTAESQPSGAQYHFVDVSSQSNQGDTFYMWGLQVEELDYATSYIPTYGTAVTRNQDIVNNAGTSATYNSVEGVLFVDVAALVADGADDRFISISDGTTDNQVSIYLNDLPGKISALISSNNVDAFLNSTGHNQLNFNKIALKYKSNDIDLWINGLNTATVTTQNAPIGLSRLNLSAATGGKFFFGKTSQIQVFNTALSDFDLQNLTSNATAYASYETMRTSLNFNIQ